MKNHIRRQQIVNAVNQVRSVTVGQLANQFHISVETVRRDLAWLEKMGRLVRMHGGARTLQQEDLGELFKNGATNIQMLKISWHARHWRW